MSLIELVPDQYRKAALNISEQLRPLDNILVSAHLHPDGDALGSMAAMGYILESLGKKFLLYSESGIPEYLHFMPLPGKVWTDLALIPFKPCAAIYLDCGEASRLGPILSQRALNIPCLNIDHHLGSGMDCLADWIVPDAAATTQLVAYLALALEIPLAGALGQNIALGLITDTGAFSHANTSAEVFALCAILAGAGCNFSALRGKLEGGWQIGHLRLWGRLFEKLCLDCSGKIAICVALAADFKECGGRREDLEGLVEYFRRLQGVQIAALIREESADPRNPVCKFSLRSQANVDVRSVAASLGGGGHRNAAGGVLALGPEAAERILAEALCASLGK